MIKNPKCIVPFISLEVGQDNIVHPCCKIKGIEPYTKNSTLDDFYSEKVNNWREQFYTELPNECAACKVTNDVFSYKELVKETWQKYHNLQDISSPSLKRVVLALDNVCASSCVMCSSKLSTTIGNLIKKNKNNSKFPIFKISNNQNLSYKKFNLESLKNHVSTIEVLQLYGGEPLISPNLPKLIEIFKESKVLNTVSITTGLNGIKESHIDLLRSQTYGVKLTVSIDGPLDLNEWIRGIKEEEFEKNFNLIKNNFSIISFQSTIGLYNVFAIPEIIKTIKNISLKKNIKLISSPINWPIELSARQLPDSIKIKVIKKLTNFLDSESCPDFAKEFVKTGIKECSKSSTVNWNDSLEYLHTIPNLRNDLRNLDFFIKKYIDDPR